jgi:hypothetical protein
LFGNRPRSPGAQFALGLQPVFECVAVDLAALQKEFVRALRDGFVRQRWYLRPDYPSATLFRTARAN